MGRADPAQPLIALARPRDRQPPWRGLGAAASAEL